jgi:hypothetical protein
MTKRETWRATILAGCLAHLGLADGARAINAWERWETALISSDTSLTPLKAYRDVQIQATFWRKIGSTCTEPATCTDPDSCFKGLGFWDGSSTDSQLFKIRSAFPFGTWCWKTCRLSDTGAGCSTADTGLNKSGEVPVSATATNSPTNSLYSNGFLKAPAGKRNLTTWNGQTIFQWIGDTAWNAPINYASSRTTWANYVAQRAKGYDGNTFAGGGGFTNILVAPAVQTLANPPSGGFRGFIAPTGCGTGDRPVVPASCHYWNSAYWRDFDDMIKVANDKGIVIVVADVIDPLNRAGSNQNISPQVLFPARVDAKIFARNLAARLAGSFVVFSPSYDAKATDPTAEPGINVAGLIDTVGAAIRSAAPRHLIGVHLAGGSALGDYDPFHSKPWFSLQLFQSGHGGGSCEGAANAYANYACRARKFALRFRCIGEPSTNACVGSGAPTGLPKKPAVNIEGQYETLGDNETRMQTRHTAWNSGLSGSFGFNIGVWPDIPRWTNPTAYAATNHYSDDDLGRMKGLFKSMPWSDLPPRHDLLVEQNNFSGTACTHATYGNLSKTDWLQLWKTHLALDAAGGYGLAYLPRPTKCTLSGSVFNTSTSIVLDRAKASTLGISCVTWRGEWISPGPTSGSNGFSLTPATCIDSGSGPVKFVVPQGKITCNDLCDRVLKLTKRTSATSNSPNAFASNSTVDLLTSVEISEDGQSSTIWGQILSDGLPIGDPIPLSGPDLLFRKLPSAVFDASGNFLVVWEEENEAGTDDIVLARFDSSLEPLGPAFVLNDTLEGQQAEPWASGDDSGDTVVAWTNYSEDDAIAGDIYVKRLDSFGQPVESETLVSAENEGNQSLPQVQMDGDGGFVVAWTSEPPIDNLDVVPPPDESSDFSVAKAAPAVRKNKGGVYFRVFGADGRPRGPERRVSSGNPGQDRLSRLEVHRHGGFKIRWREFDTSGSDKGEREQEHDQDGKSVGEN